MSDGFDALGERVPERRRQAGYDALKEMIPDSTAEQRFEMIARMCEYIERDEPYAALRTATGGAPFEVAASAPAPEDGERVALRLDVTGGYRLFAHLVTA